jgi:hypothetical protein
VGSVILDRQLFAPALHLLSPDQAISFYILAFDISLQVLARLPPRKFSSLELIIKMANSGKL